MSTRKRSTSRSPKAAARRQNSGGFPQDRLVLILRVEEPEGIHQDGGGDAFRSKRQSPHVATNPPSVKIKIRRKMAGTVQESGRRVDADDFSSAFGEGERMPPMTATDVKDVSTWRKLQEPPQADHLRSNMADGAGRPHRCA